MRNLENSSLVVVLGLNILAGCGAQPLPDTAAGTVPTGCVPLVVSSPAVSTDGISLFWPAEKMNNPKAGDPTYIYLEAGREGVVLHGPNVPDTSGPFALQSQSIDLMTSSVDPDASPLGYRAVINQDFGYMVAIDDFEMEVSLARVDLCQQSGSITSQFVLVANPGASGVARDLTITAAAHSTTISAPTSPVTIEVR